MDLKLLQGDNLEHLKDMEDNSVDSVVTDPPYGLKFMGKKWDHSVPSVEFWKEVLRVLKPGGHVLSFGGTRTYHRMAVNIEDAGFEIRDQIQWLYGSGFPKSHNISKAIDKKFGANREVVSEKSYADGSKARKTSAYRGNCMSEATTSGANNFVTDPATPLAKKWDGFGTALKPANEPIVLARKPLSEKTIVDNVLKHGTGGLNIDGCRVETGDNLNGGRYSENKKGLDGNSYGSGINLKSKDGYTQPQGRFPANIILDEEAGQALDEQSGSLSKQGSPKVKDSPGNFYGGGTKDTSFYGDKGGASRFFYCAKASKKERGTENNHPTVKPVKLMEYLTRLITPPGGTVLDPFMGSGTTGLAAKNEGFGFIGIELNSEYYEIAQKRVNI